MLKLELLWQMESNKRKRSDNTNNTSENNDNNDKMKKKTYVWQDVIKALYFQSLQVTE